MTPSDPPVLTDEQRAEVVAARAEREAHVASDQNYYPDDPEIDDSHFPPPDTPLNGHKAEKESSQHPEPLRLVDGASFILDIPAGVPALWGENENVLWPQGEPFLVCGPAGVGKTTLVQQLVLASVGVLDPELLGYPVTPAERVLYLAMDRPAQASRSFARMVGEEHRQALGERLVVWKGPLDFSVQRNPEGIFEKARAAGASVVVIDSVKDLVAELEKSEPAAKVNAAMQMCVAADIEVVGIHHQRKQQTGAGKPTSLSDVYGSTWLTAGAGSVVLMWGDPGEPIVELSHLKQPVADVGPLHVLHDHINGRTTTERGFNLLTYMRMRGKGVSAQDVATARFGKADPNRSQVEKARRQLESLTKRGLAHKTEGSHVPGTAEIPAAYHLVDLRKDEDF